MPEIIGPAVARERLRARLRQLRTARELSVESAAGVLNWPPSALEDVEAGRRTISPLEAAALAAAYGVTDKTEAAALTALAYRARTPLWWSSNGLSEAFRHYTGYEAEAEQITVYQPFVAPGLLQTEPYARAATAAILGSDPGADDVSARVAIRLERQQIFAERLATGPAPHLLVILEEAVLHRPIGGPGVLRAQLDHLIAEAAKPHLTLVVLPTQAGGHAGLSGAFELLQFADAPDLVYIESLTDDYIVREAPASARYRDNVARLQSVGKIAGEAVEMIESAKNSGTGT